MPAESGQESPCHAPAPRIGRRTPARSVPAPAAVTITFTAPGTYTRSDTGATTYAYTQGQAIEYNLVTPGSTGWTLKLKGSALAGDTYTVEPNAFPRLNAGNAEALMALLAPDRQATREQMRDNARQQAARAGDWQAIAERMWAALSF